jgi:hypothetical protein
MLSNLTQPRREAEQHELLVRILPSGPFDEDDLTVPARKGRCGGRGGAGCRSCRECDGHCEAPTGHGP